MPDMNLQNFLMGLIQQNATLKDLDLNIRIMPRDVCTRWNSTFDMLEFSLQYRPAIDAITDNRDMKMRKLKLDAQDWVIATQLHDTLKACHPFYK